MPYVSTDQVKEIRDRLKAALPQFKLSVRKRHHMTVDIAFMSGPIPLSTKAHEQVNTFYPETAPGSGRDEFGRQVSVNRCPVALAVLQKAIDIAKMHRGQSHYDSDYGNIPTYYVDVNVGKWDRDYVVQAKRVSMSAA